MADEYRFLRFESVGITTIIFSFVGLIPFLPHTYLDAITHDLSSLAGIIAVIFLLSLPLGYFSHQFVVNDYRSHKLPRMSHDLLENIIKDISISINEETFLNSFSDLEKISFITSLIDLFIYQEKNTIKSDIHDRLSSLWSHFYARKAVGNYSMKIALILQILFILILKYLNFNIIISIENVFASGLWWIFIILICYFLINPYSSKIYLELSYLEIQIILSNIYNIKDTLKLIIFNYQKYI